MKRLRGFDRVLAGAGAAILTGCATPAPGIDVISQATSSPYFTLTAPVVHAFKGGEVLDGRVCRRARGTLLSPPRVRLEHMSSAGAVMETAQAYIPAIYHRPDQACSRYSAHVAWQFTAGDKVRACFDRGRGCVTAPTATAVVAAPATPSP